MLRQRRCDAAARAFDLQRVRHPGIAEQYVSATYTGSALGLAWVELSRSQQLQNASDVRAYAWASGLLFAGLCALKTTFFLLCAALFGLTVCALSVRAGWRRALAWAGTALSAWVAMLLPWVAVHANTPFWLNFTRNNIADVEPAGIATPWSRIPQAEYVLWEYNGFATVQPRVYEKERDRPALLQARIGDAGLRLTSVLIELARATQVLHNDGRIMVLKLPTATTLAKVYAATKPTR